MRERHEFQFRGVWIPAEVMEGVASGSIKAPDVVLLSLIDALVAPDVGCYASNEWLAKRTGVHVRKVQERLAKLKNLGLVRQVGFDGKRRYLETAWSRAGTPAPTLGPPVEVPKAAPLRCRKRHGALKAVERNARSGPTAPDHASFGMVATSNGKATEADLAVATRILEIAQGHLGTSHILLKRARPTAWADHIRLLREQDGVAEHRIDRVLGWYATHVGEEFVPEAYAGESFRKKFFAIERQMERDVVATTEPGQHAKQIASRLAGMGWPKGAGTAVPAAAQACLDAYGAWVAGLATTIDKLRRDDLAEDYGAERLRLLKFAQHLTRTMPSPDHFTERWLRVVHERVKGWDDWGGDLGPFIFKPRAKRFRAMGRGWAEAYCGDPERWDRFVEVMQREGE